jgi:hypothetical protein
VGSDPEELAATLRELGCLDPVELGLEVVLERICESPGSDCGGSLPGFDVRQLGMTQNGSGARPGCLGDELSAVGAGVDLARRLLA